MKHFSNTEWADFVRDVVSEEQRPHMEKHLNEGCSSCAKTVQVWKSVTECARREASYEPPASALRMAEAYFVPIKLAMKQTTNLLFAQLMFDSFQHRAAAGTRGSDAAAQQLMYKCGEVFIDLRLEAKPVSDQVAMVGQIADTRQPARSVAGMAVSLLSDSTTLSQTSTNHLGEFRFMFRASEHLQLLVAMTETTVIVPLPMQGRDLD